MIAHTRTLDAPIFDPCAYKLSDKQIYLTDLARQVGQESLAPRAAQYDREASFPIENYRDMFNAGLMGICIPEQHGGHGADILTYAMTAAELGRYCGATALTWNMHVSSTLWTGDITDDLAMTAAEREIHDERRAIHYRRIIEDGAIYSQPFSEGGAAAAGKVAWSTQAVPTDQNGGGWIVNGKKIFASLSGHANYYGILCTELKPGEKPSRRNSVYVAVPADAPGVTVSGEWDPMGMRGTVSRTLHFKDVFVPEEAMLMPRGIYYAAASQWPHMFLTLCPAYLGLCQAAFDFTVNYLRGEYPGLPPVKRRMYPTKQIAVAQMKIMLEQTKALFHQTLSEAQAKPNKDQLLRAWTMQYTVMENASELAQLAIRTCGGQSMLKSLPLERIFRDARCGALMLPWTAEICLDNLGKGILYERGETDD
ncbi:MAG: acyl-CoA dehydrogenase family protein [Chloroflexota bacterium]